MPSTDNTLVKAMLDPGFYNHPVQHVQLIETHISWVFLTGEFVYKVKKPVNFGFLDFTDLQKRKFYCEEELRLNRRLAADIYLNVTPITKVDGTYRIGDDGDAIEYAVVMKQFDQDGLLDNKLQRHQVTLQHMEQLADRLAAFHQQIDRADANSSFGDSDEVIKPVQQNFVLLRDILSESRDLDKLTHIEQASMTLYRSVKTIFDQRKQQGFVRECHGDMHSGNIALLDDRVLIFDGIEFNDSFKWIDTMSELAFLIMDLQDHGQFDFAAHLLNRYLHNSGDFEGLQVLRFYQLYRAMVRAKVNGLHMQQQPQGSKEQAQDLTRLRNYLDLAIDYTRTAQPYIGITYGVSGSGKTWLSVQLADQAGSIVIRSDVERKRLFGDTDNLYSADLTRQTYQRLLQLAKQIVQSGYGVLVDATFLDRDRRDTFFRLAQELDVAFHILHCHADTDLLRQRIEQRQQAGRDVSDADVGILDMQMKKHPHLDEDESGYVIDINTGQPLDIQWLAGRLVSAEN